jgi:phosphodiesterase/alkaline phosphatase D-like protein
MTSLGVPYATFVAFLPDNPHVRFFESRLRGYVRCEITPDRWATDLRILDDVRDPRTRVRTLASFLVENGRRASGWAARRPSWFETWRDVWREDSIQGKPLEGRA